MRRIERACLWCEGLLRPDARRDALTCSKRCRQARARFLRAVGHAPEGLLDETSGSGRHLAYADPPYPGRSSYYRDHRDYAGEVDHAVLVDQLMTYDGWALSTAADALPAVLEVCPPDVQVAAWHHGHRPHLNPSGPLNAWEPVIYRRPPALRCDTSPRGLRDTSAQVLRDSSELSSRDTSVPALCDVSRSAARDTSVEVLRDTYATVQRDTSAPGQRDTWATSTAGATAVTDSLVYPARARTTDPNRVIGAKPAVFARWIFDLLGARPSDTLDDLYPGSGTIGRAWRAYAGPASAPAHA